MKWTIKRRYEGSKSETLEGDFPAIVYRVAELLRKNVQIENVLRNGQAIEGKTAFDIMNQAHLLKAGQQPIRLPRRNVE